MKCSSLIQKIYKFICLLSVLAGNPLDGRAQTTAAGTVSSIEQLARSFMDDQKRIQESKTAIQTSYQLEAERLAEMQAELHALIQEKANALAELRSGLYCSQCNRPKSQIERETGKSFRSHLTEVSGVPKAATPEAIQAKSDEYNRKIADLEEKIRKFQFEENEFTRKRYDLEKRVQQLEDKCAEVCDKMKDLNVKYKEAIGSETESTYRHKQRNLIELVAKRHYYEDRIDLLRVHISDLKKDELQALNRSKKKVAEETDRKKQQLRQEIERNKNNILEIERFAASTGRQLEKQLAAFKKTRDSLSLVVSAASSTDDALRSRLGNDIRELDITIGDLRNRIRESETKMVSETNALKSRNQDLDREIWDLTVSLPQLQLQAEENIRNGYALKEKVLNDAIAARQAEIGNVRTKFADNEQEFETKHRKFLSEIDKEVNRIYNAYQITTCTYFSAGAAGVVNQTWNDIKACVQAMESLRKNNAFYGCEEASEVYKKHYAMLVNGLSESDKKALQRANSGYYYNTILNTLN